MNFPFFREITPPQMDLFLAGTIFRDFSRIYPFQGESSLKMGTPFLTPNFLRGFPQKKGQARILSAPVVYQIKSENGILHSSMGFLPKNPITVYCTQVYAVLGSQERVT